MRGSQSVMLVALAAMVIAPSCRTSEASPLPGKPQTIDVSLQEYKFVYTAPNAPGRVVFRAHNDGQLPHNMVLVFLGDDLPPLDEQLRGSERQIVSTIAALPERAPRTTGTFAVDLDPGRYGIICFITDPDGTQHAKKGMNSEFRIS